VEPAGLGAQAGRTSSRAEDSDRSSAAWFLPGTDLGWIPVRAARQGNGDRREVRGCRSCGGCSRRKAIAGSRRCLLHPMPPAGRGRTEDRSSSRTRRTCLRRAQRPPCGSRMESGRASDIRIPAGATHIKPLGDGGLCALCVRGTRPPARIDTPIAPPAAAGGAVRCVRPHWVLALHALKRRRLGLPSDVAG
jgi:hypothetical protein